MRAKCGKQIRGFVLCLLYLLLYSEGGWFIIGLKRRIKARDIFQYVFGHVWNFQNVHPVLTLALLFLVEVLQQIQANSQIISTRHLILTYLNILKSKTFIMLESVAKPNFENDVQFVKFIFSGGSETLFNLYRFK